MNAHYQFVRLYSSFIAYGIAEQRACDWRYSVYTRRRFCRGFTAVAQRRKHDTALRLHNFLPSRSAYALFSMFG